jgi:hypothetical protein
MRHGGNLFLNALACCTAASWNIVHLPPTLKIRRREARQIRLAQLQRETQGGVEEKVVAHSPAPVTCVGSYSTETPSL